MTTRFALVIGNSIYQDADPVSGVKDAELMTEKLEKLDFDVIKVTNGKLGAMTTGGLDELVKKISNASVVVFSFSGHGFQNGNENYLMPTDGTINPASAVSLAAVRNALAWAPKNAIKLLFLDACRPNKNLPEGSHRGLNTENAPALPNTLYAFAAASDQETTAGDPDSLSPYSEAVLRHLRTPGLGINELLDLVNKDVGKIGLTPVSLNQGVPKDFMLRDAVSVLADVTKADDNLFLILGNDIALTASQNRQAKLTLKEGNNPFTVLVANDKTYLNNHDWSVTEGWDYEMNLTQAGTGSTFNGLSLKEPGEEIPFKDGQHHGKVFVAARGNLFVDAEPKLATVTVRDLNTKVWQQDPPVAEKFQTALYKKSLAELPINLDEVVSDAFNLGNLVVFGIDLRPAVRQVLQTGEILGVAIADPKKIFVLVLGTDNDKLRKIVEFCMTDQLNDRIADLKTSLAAALARKERPFDSFDQHLTNAIQQEARNRGLTDPKPEEIRVWTALDDESKP